MSRTLDAPRGADFPLLYRFPSSLDVTGYTASFVIYAERNGSDLLTVTDTTTVNGSSFTFSDQNAALMIKAADIDALPLNDDETAPAILAFDVFLSSPLDVQTKIHGGTFRVWPLGDRHTTAESDLSVTLDGTTFDVRVGTYLLDTGDIAEEVVDSLVARRSLGVFPQTYGAIGDGVTNDRAAVAAADAAASAAGVPLVITKPFHIGSSLTLNADLLFQGGRLDHANSAPLTINGDIRGGFRQIFSGWPADDPDNPRLYDSTDQERLTITSGQDMRLEWFGAVADGVTNCKPALQRLAFAAPESFSITCRKGGVTYLFDNGGIYYRTGRPCTSVFIDRVNVEIFGNRARWKLADETQYSIAVFGPNSAITDLTVKPLESFYVHDLKLDGNLEGNEDQYLEQVGPLPSTGEGSRSNKGYGALLYAKGYEQATARQVHVLNTIHSGVDFWEVDQATFDTCRARGGFPMMYDVYNDQAHYFAARGNYTGYSTFNNMDCVGGSHHLTHHTTLDDTDPHADMFTQCVITNYKGRDAAESFVHVESCEVIKLDNWRAEITDAQYSSTNVSSIELRPYSRRGVKFIDVQVSNGALINGGVYVYDELGNGNNYTGRVQLNNVHLEQNITDLIEPVRIRAPNAGHLEACSVRGYPATPISGGESAGDVYSIQAVSAHKCIVSYAPGVAIYDSWTEGEIYNVTDDMPAITCNSPTRCRVDTIVDTAYSGVRHKFGDLDLTGTFQNLQTIVVDNESTTGRLYAHNAFFRDWGLVGGLDSTSGAAITAPGGTGDGAWSPVVIVENVRFESVAVGASTYTIRANQTGQQVILKGCSGTSGLHRPSFQGGGGCLLEPFIGVETVTATSDIMDSVPALIGQGMPWSIMRHIDLTLGSAETITHVFSESQQPASFRDAQFEVYITNGNASFDFTKANGADVRAQALRHASLSTWSPTAGAWMRCKWDGKYWVCETQDA